MMVMIDLNWWIPYLITQGIVVVALSSPVWWLLLVLVKYIKGKKK
jgi:hypothetical protein